jgi:ubiquinone/menaquinone biosynthesis C-methylase UbiE
MDGLRNIVFFQWYYQKLTKVTQPIFGVKRQKEFYEWCFWFLKKISEGKKMSNSHYEFFFTEYFGLTRHDYNNAKVLDIGCGPRGSLEWADMTAERVGLDTLAKKYLKLEGQKHKMTYVQAGAEDIPFEDGHFDIVTSFNSLDHVDELNTTIQEIKRVTKKGGKFLLIVDIHEAPTLCEPSAFGWKIVEQFGPEFKCLKEDHFEGNLLYKSIREGIPYDHSNKNQRYGILTALFERA